MACNFFSCLRKQLFVVSIGIVLRHHGQHFAVLADFRPAGVDRAIVAHRVGEVVVYVPCRDIEESPFDKRHDTGVEGVLKRVHIVVAVAAEDIDSAERRVTVFGMVADARDFFQQQSVQAEFPEAGVRHVDLHGRIQIAGPDCVDVIQGFVELRCGGLASRRERKVVVVVMSFFELRAVNQQGAIPDGLGPEVARLFGEHGLFPISARSLAGKTKRFTGSQPPTSPSQTSFLARASRIPAKSLPRST